MPCGAAKKLNKIIEVSGPTLKYHKIIDDRRNVYIAHVLWFYIKLRFSLNMIFTFFILKLTNTVKAVFIYVCFLFSEWKRNSTLCSLRAHR